MGTAYLLCHQGYKSIETLWKEKGPNMHWLKVLLWVFVFILFSFCISFFFFSHLMLMIKPFFLLCTWPLCTFFFFISMYFYCVHNSILLWNKKMIILKGLTVPFKTTNEPCRRNYHQFTFWWYSSVTHASCNQPKYRDFLMHLVKIHFAIISVSLGIVMCVAQ